VEALVAVALAMEKISLTKTFNCMPSDPLPMKRPRSTFVILVVAILRLIDTRGVCGEVDEASITKSLLFKTYFNTLTLMH
jgi:hypothetical protein